MAKNMGRDQMTLGRKRHNKEFGLNPNHSGKLLEGFKQGTDMI